MREPPGKSCTSIIPSSASINKINPEKGALIGKKKFVLRSVIQTNIYSISPCNIYMLFLKINICNYKYVLKCKLINNNLLNKINIHLKKLCLK